MALNSYLWIVHDDMRLHRVTNWCRQQAKAPDFVSTLQNVSTNFWVIFLILEIDFN